MILRVLLIVNILLQTSVLLLRAQHWYFLAFSACDIYMTSNSFYNYSQFFCSLFSSTLNILTELSKAVGSRGAEGAAATPVTKDRHHSTTCQMLKKKKKSIKHQFCHYFSQKYFSLPIILELPLLCSMSVFKT